MIIGPVLGFPFLDGEVTGKNDSPSPHWTRREKYMQLNGLYRLMKSFCFALNYFVLKFSIDIFIISLSQFRVAEFRFIIEALLFKTGRKSILCFPIL